MLGMDLYNQLADFGYWMMPESAYVARYMLLVSSLLLGQHFQRMPAQITRKQGDPAASEICCECCHGNSLPAFTVTSGLLQNGGSLPDKTFFGIRNRSIDIAFCFHMQVVFLPKCCDLFHHR